ncbi:MAG: DMT family transporter [Pseudomonadota bacterium]
MTGTPQPSLSDYALLLFLSVLLGSNFAFIKVAVSELPSELFVFGRLFIGAAIIYALMRMAGLRLPQGAVWKPIILSGFFGYTFPFALISWGQERVDSSVASILMATMPLFTLAMAQVLTRDEKPNRYSVSGFLIAMVGILLLFGFDSLLSLGDNSVRQYAIALAAISFGYNAIITKDLTGIEWQSLIAALLLISVVLAAPLLAFVDWGNVSASATAWGALVYAGVGPTALGAVLIWLVVQRQGASFLSQLNFIVPVVGVFIGLAFLRENLPQNGWLALLLIMAGVTLARRRPKRELISINKGV